MNADDRSCTRRAISRDISVMTKGSTFWTSPGAFPQRARSRYARVFPPSFPFCSTPSVTLNRSCVASRYKANSFLFWARSGSRVRQFMVYFRQRRRQTIPTPTDVLVVFSWRVGAEGLECVWPVFPPSRSSSCSSVSWIIFFSARSVFVNVRSACRTS